MEEIGRTGEGSLATSEVMFNAYDRRTARPDARGAEAVGGSALREQFDALLPRVPSFGVTFDF